MESATLTISSVNLLGILGDEKAGCKGMAGRRGRMWEEIPLYQGRGLGQA